jgi:hypothetical protein
VANVVEVGRKRKHALTMQQQLRKRYLSTVLMVAMSAILEAPV